MRLRPLVTSTLTVLALLAFVAIPVAVAEEEAASVSAEAADDGPSGQGFVPTGAVGFGVDQDATGLARGQAGVLYNYYGLAAEAHLGFDGFLKFSSNGISAKSLSLSLGGRYALTNAYFRGPYITGAVGYGFFLGKPNDRVLSGEPEVCATAMTDPGEEDSCTYRINRNINMRLGFGWGFKASEKTTVGIRVDATYWVLGLEDFEQQNPGSPIPREVLATGVQDSFAIIFGIEFLHFN